MGVATKEWKWGYPVQARDEGDVNSGRGHRNGEKWMDGRHFLDIK